MKIQTYGTLFNAYNTGSSFSVVIPSSENNNVLTLVNEWVKPDFWSSIGQIFTGSITDVILSFRLYPFNVSKYMYNFVKEGIISYNNGSVTSNAYGKLLTDRLITLFLGSYFIEDEYGDFRDYNGYTEINVYLPYYGLVSIDVNTFKGYYVKFYLTVDFSTGSGIWQICRGTNSTKDLTIDQIIQQFECQVGIEIPVASSNVVDNTRNLILGAVNVGVSVATAKIPSTRKTTTTTTSTKIGRSKKAGSKMKLLEQGEKTTKTISKYYGSQTSALLDSSVQALNNLRANVSTTNNIGNGLNISNPQKVYIIKYSPNYATDNYMEEFAYLYGRPLGEVRKLSNLKGYTEIASLHLEGFGFGTATTEELEELKITLTSGIIL